MHRFQFYAPATIQEAIGVLRDHAPNVKVLAGGTDLLVQMKEAGRHPAVVVSLQKLKELRGIRHDAETGLHIGALTLVTEVEHSPLVLAHFNPISQGAHLIGSIQIRNIATIGGNICNAAPSADVAPPLIAMGARAHIVGSNGEREVPLDDFFVGPGRTVLQSDELLTEIIVPNPPPYTDGVYQRHTPRKWMDIAAVGVGIVLTLEAGDHQVKDAKVVLGAVAPTPLRARETEAQLIGRPLTPETIQAAAQTARREARPISDTRGSAGFRRTLVENMTARCLALAADRARAAK